MKKEWRQRKPKREYKDTYSVIDKLIAVNGIDDPFRFLYPTEEELHNPYLLKNIEAARDRIAEAIEQKQIISIFADVDSDGISSTALKYRYLLNYTDKVRYFHSQRGDGHGIQTALNIIPEGTKLLIIVDSSSNEVDACKEIKNRGIDIVIIDHHTVDESNEHVILVNPKQEGCEYPNKHASGSLLSWKMCQILDDHFRTNYSDELIDLAAFGLYSDMMDVGAYSLENRFLVNHLLENIHSVGLNAILKVIGKEKEKLYSTTIGYNITPFINAPTRLDKIEIPLELMCTDDPELALELAKRIKELNEERKKVQKEAVTRLRPLVNENDKCIVLTDSSLGKGYNGLVANDLMGIYQRPVIIFGEKEDEYQGSFRSYGGFDFLEFVGTLDMVVGSGGHPEAGGIGIKKKDLELFKNTLNNKLKNEKFEQVIEYDFELNADEINEKLVTQVQNFCRVSGTGFEEARFLVKDLVVNQKKIIGSGDTLRLGCLKESDTWFMSEKEFAEAKPSFVAMKFKADEQFIEGINEGDKIDVVCTLNLNLWTKYKPRYEVVKTLQLFLEDYRMVNN